MLTKIDDSFIRLFQWVIHQIELFTSFDRITCLNLSLIPVLMSTGVIIAFVFPELNRNLIIFFLLPLVAECISVTLATESEKKEPPNTLPRAIKKRRVIRIAVTSISIVLICADFMPRFYLLYVSENLFSKATPSLLLYLTPFVFCPLTEYLLCTTTLPPGEKEARHGLPNGA